MHESFVWFRSCVLANPQSSISLLDEVLGFCAVDVLKGMPINDFSFVGTHFKTHLGIQRDGDSFGPGFPIGAGSALLAGDSKGDRVPLAVVSKGGGAALAGGIQWRAAPSVAGRIQ